MPHRNVLSLFRRLTGVALAAAIALSLPATAETPTEFPLLSMLTPPLAEPAAASPSDALTLHEVHAAPQPPSNIDLTAPADNLWERIRNGFSMNDLNDDLVLYYQQWYQNRPDALRRMVERSRPYLHYIVGELEARGMPTELAFLPMVESSFNPMAYSRAHASGLWQFIPATGKRFNLEQNWWQDQRRDIVASTGAALDYLQSIYDLLGDWQLALASYNWGEGAVKRAVEKNAARGLPGDYASLTMPNETRHYVPKLQALKNIFGNPALVAQLDLPQIPNRPYFVTLETPSPMDVKTAARLANMSVSEFQQLNPSHNRPIIKQSTAVVLPADKLNTFQENLQQNRAPLSSWQGYTLKAPERLNQIADQFGISAGELARANGLSESVRLGAGTTLIVPGGGNSDNLNPLLAADEPTHIIEPEPVIRACGKSARHGKHSAHACTRESRQIAKNDNRAEHGHRGSPAPSGKLAARGNSAKQARAGAGKPAAKLAAKASHESHKSANAKQATPTKVAKSGNGRRG